MGHIRPQKNSENADARKRVGRNLASSGFARKVGEVLLAMADALLEHLQIPVCDAGRLRNFDEYQAIKLDTQVWHQRN